MKRTLTYIITVILSIAFGCALMYGLIYFFPNTVIKTITKEQKVVNVVDDGIAEGISNVYTSVVVAEAYKNNTLVSTGSGFAFKKNDDSTYIITNYHVISGGNKVIVTLSNETEIEASIIGSDAYSDIAVLKVKSNDNLAAANIGDTSEMKVGDTVFAVGAPMGKTFANTVTRGILSGKDRMVETSVSGSASYDWIMNVMQTDAAINPGNSGGPLCNASGEVIGVNSMKIVESSVEGLGFAIPIEDALSYAESLIKDGKISRGYIGIEMINATETFQLLRNGIELDSKVNSGVVIANVVDDSPAKSAGLKKEDVIVKVNNYDVENISEFRYYLYKYNVGETVTLLIYRSGETKNIKVKIASSE